MILRPRGRFRRIRALGGGKIVVGSDAPQGTAYCRLEGRKGAILRTPPRSTASPASPTFSPSGSKAPAEYWAAITFTSAEREPSFCELLPATPATGDQWKHVGYYFWMPAQCQTVQFQHPAPARTALRESSSASTTCSCGPPPRPKCRPPTRPERAQLPPYDVTPAARRRQEPGTLGGEVGRPGRHPRQALRDLGPRIELDPVPRRRLRADPGHSPAVSPAPADRVQAARRLGHALGLCRRLGAAVRGGRAAGPDLHLHQRHARKGSMPC